MTAPPARGSLRSAFSGTRMLRTMLRLAPLALLAVAAGCHGVSVDSTHAEGVDWKSLHTYDWLTIPATSPTAAKDETAVGVLATTLEKKGLKRSQQQPDLLVAVQRTIEGSLNTKQSGYEWRDGRMHSYTLQEGSLVIDLVDAKTKEIVWRSSASGAFRSDQTSGERREFLTNLLNEMFEHFPPGS